MALPADTSALARGLEHGLADLGLPVPKAQRGQLLDYLGLLAKWNRVYNLTAVRDPQQMLVQHLLDCLAVVAPVRRALAAWAPEPVAATRVLDVGAGAGLPGVVLAVCCPELEIDCIDTVGKKVAFVRQVSTALALPRLRGLHGRVEAVTDHYPLVCSRAFASLADFTAGSRAALRPGGLWLAMKGKLPEAEIAALPPDIETFHVEQLHVPGLGADRCLVWMRRRA